MGDIVKGMEESLLNRRLRMALASNSSSCGSDYVSVKRAPMGAWSCENIVVSDINRLADFSGPGMAVPLRIKGFTVCKRVDFDINHLRARAEMKAAMVFVRLSFISSGMLESMLKEVMDIDSPGCTRPSCSIFDQGTLSDRMDELAEELLPRYLNEFDGLLDLRIKDRSTLGRSIHTSQSVSKINQFYAHP